MGKLKRKEWSPDPQVRTTAWVGDEDADLDASDVEEWCASANPEALVSRPRGKLTRIRYRALTERELMALGPPTGDDLLVWFVEAARYGLVSIDGEDLGRVSRKGLRQIDQKSTDDLCDIKAEIPLDAAIAQWSAVYYGHPLAAQAANQDEDEEAGEDATESEPPPAAPAPVERKEVEYVITPLPLWLGIHVLIATFRGRTGNDR
jgi:hypothetical protein